MLAGKPIIGSYSGFHLINGLNVGILLRLIMLRLLQIFFSYASNAARRSHRNGKARTKWIMANRPYKKLARVH